MVERNEFQAYRQKNKTKIYHRCHATVKLTAFALLLLSPLVTDAIDSTKKLRGKENDLGNLLHESIDSLMHVPVESDSIRLSTGEEESSHLFHIRLPHESSMLDEAQVKEVESFDIKSSNVLKNDFLEQAKKSSMTLTSDTGKPNGEHCMYDEDCESGRCTSYNCEDKLPNGETCFVDDDCESGRCSGQLCTDKLSLGEGCFVDDDCQSNVCYVSSTVCINTLYATCCLEVKGEPLPNGERCSKDDHCESARCSASLVCKDKLSVGESCLMNNDCESNVCKWDDTCDGVACCKEAPPPSPGPCFSSTSMVNHMKHGLVPISDINIGDYIQSNTDGFFSRVYAFKKNNHEDTEFYQLHSRTGTLVEVTDRHLVFLKNKSLPIAARDVRIGDVLKSGNPEDDTEVVKIELIHREGYYNPFTESGTFVLNDGVVASSYDVSSSSSSDFFDGPTEMLHWHTLAHFACAPLRFVCKTMNFDVCSDSDNQNEEGLHKFIVFLTTLRKLKYWQQVVVLPLIFGAGVLFTLLEFFYDLVGEAFYATISSTSAEAATAQHDGSFGFLMTFSLTVAALVPSVILVWRKKYHLSSD